jgi:hypothetical protein
VAEISAKLDIILRSICDYIYQKGNSYKAAQFFLLLSSFLSRNSYIFALLLRTSIVQTIRTYASNPRVLNDLQRTRLSRRRVVTSLSQSSCVSPFELTDGRGEEVGEEPNHRSARKPGPL